jgi:hypothetical protein
LLVRPRVVRIQCNCGFELDPRFGKVTLPSTKIPHDSARHLAVRIAGESFADQLFGTLDVFLGRVT